MELLTWGGVLAVNGGGYPLGDVSVKCFSVANDLKATSSIPLFY